MQDCIFADLQGFKTNENEFIVKEFAYSTMEYTQVFLIKPPFPFSKLTESEKRQTRWIEKHYGILWREGFVDDREFQRLIVNHIKNKTIFVKGMEKIQWIKHLCVDCTIIDLGENGVPNLQELIKKYCVPECMYNCVYHKKRCALKNVICIKKWYLDKKENKF
jgi:hypothetical protein